MTNQRQDAETLLHQGKDELLHDVERNRTRRLARGNMRFQNGSYTSVLQQQQKKQNHPATMKALNEFFGIER